jgi:hypothetical protein
MTAVEVSVEKVPDRSLRLSLILFEVMAYIYQSSGVIQALVSAAFQWTHSYDGKECRFYQLASMMQMRCHGRDASYEIKIQSCCGDGFIPPTQVGPNGGSSLILGLARMCFSTN